MSLIAYSSLVCLLFSALLCSAVPAVGGLWHPAHCAAHGQLPHMDNILPLHRIHRGGREKERKKEGRRRGRGYDMRWDRMGWGIVNTEQWASLQQPLRRHRPQLNSTAQNTALYTVNHTAQNSALHCTIQHSTA